MYKRQGLVGVDLHGGLEVVAQHLLVRDDLHRAAAEHKARAHEHRVADLGRGADAVFDVRDGAALRLRDLQLLQDLLEALARCV